MSTVTLEEAQAHLPELIDQLRAGDEVIIVRDERAVARLSALPSAAARVPKLGTLRGTVTYMAPDFDAPLDDFREYSG